MGHWTIRVGGVESALDLERAVVACARLSAPVTAARWHRSHLHLELAQGAPTEELAQSLKSGRFTVEVAPGDHQLETLSDREQELLAHLAYGLQMKEAARRMGVTTSTAREYWDRAKRKLEVRTIGQAASLWTAARR